MSVAPQHLVLSIFSVGVLVLSGGTAHAQTCVNNDGQEDPSGDLVVTTENCYGNTEFAAHYASSKGAHANAMVFTAPSPATGTCAINGTQNACVAYTRDCMACGDDPNGYPGEISCWCTDPATIFAPVSFPTVAPGNKETFSSMLLSDTNRDGDSTDVDDKEWSSQPANNNGSDQLRTYKMHADLYRFDWEDLYNSGNGDFNDYSAFLEARTCGKLPFPLASYNGEANIDCSVDCPPSQCPPGTITSSDLKLHVAFGVDKLSTEFDRERRGRTIHVTVTSYGSGNIAGRRLAICPILWFRTKNGGAAADDIHRVNYGKAAQSCADNSNRSGQPACSHFDAPHPAGIYPVSLAREQEYAVDSCATPPTGRGDTFEVPAGVVCSGYAGAHIENYELAIAEVDAQLSSVNDQLGLSAPEQDIIDRLDYITFNIIQDPPGDFFCPAGVNVWMHGVNPQVGNNTDYNLQFTENPFSHSPNVSVYTRE